MWLEYLADLEIDLQGWTTLSFKFNIKENWNEDTICEKIDEIIDYVIRRSSSDDKLFVSCGKHIDGVKENPHIHVHICCLGWKPLDSNLSRDRKKHWDTYCESIIPGLSMKECDVESPENVRKHMSYPLKEKCQIHVEDKNIHLMPADLLVYLEEIAVAEYESVKYNRASKERSYQRLLDLSSQVLLITKDKSFDTYQEYKEYTYSTFYKDLEITSYPTLTNLQKVIQNVAIFKKIVPPYYFDKY